jgi:hypothetical protein
MNTTSRDYRNLATVVVVIACCFCLSGCDGDYAVPITSSPTRKIDPRLLGNWVSKGGTEKMKVRKFDDSFYIVSYDGDLYRAHHSDVGKTAFVSAQEIDSASRKYVYLAYKLSDDGQQLQLRGIESKVIPKETKDSLSVQELLKNNAQNSQLFGDEGQYVREK